MTTIRITTTTVFLLIGLSLFAANTNKPIVLFKDQSAHISQSGHPMKLPDGADNFPDFGGVKSKFNKGVAVSGWEDGFRKKFEENIPYLVNQLESDLVQVKLQSQGGGKANFEVNIYVFCIHDCEPCSGEDAFSQEYLATYLEFVDVRTKQILHITKTEANFTIEGEPNLKESVNRAWSEYLRSFIKEDQLKGIITDLTYITDAKITFRAKNASDKLPLKADGKKKGVVKIDKIETEQAHHPVGEISSSPLTEFELSCENGNLIDKDGSEVKKIKFRGDEFPVMPGFLEFDYVVYNCDEQCEKYDNFSLKLKSQNGTDLVREIKKHKEEFECYGYTLMLEYSETNEMTGRTKITATWECVKISFGEPGEEPVVMDMGAAMGGEAIDTNGDPLLPPYTIPMAIEDGLIHVSAPIKNNSPATYNLSVSPGGLIEPATHLHINVSEEYLTNPPELILVKAPVDGTETCGGMVPPGVYLEWQFDIWGNIPDLGLSQLYSPAASMCPLLSNIPNSTTARVPESAIAAMKEGKAFTFTNSNDFGTYIITGIPQQQ
jgi:hypothetical protein